MAALSTGGGTSAVAASTHAGCERFRHTDPMVIGISRRKLADTLNHPDTSGSIPQARRMRANTFERLVRAEEFVSPLITKAIGAISLPRPTAVKRAQCGINVARTAEALERAHEFAMTEGGATLLTDLAIPFVGLEDAPDATAVKPDFAVASPRFDDMSDIDGAEPDGSWLIMGDAKDYERVRSRIDDGRMLKGFLQVALGAESIEAWSALPAGMEVHSWGALAVPRNAFLQPEPVVENLGDHRQEVRTRAAQRTFLMEQNGGQLVEGDELSQFVEHLVATYDPASCSTCSLYRYCKTELRATTTGEALLIELGVRFEDRGALLALVEGKEVSNRAPASEVARVRASLVGEAEIVEKRRTDFAGEPNTVNLVLAKSDSAALGVYGIGLQVADATGAFGEWDYHVFTSAQNLTTRLSIMALLGRALSQAMQGAAGRNPTPPIHLVLPDQATGDVLASMADSIAGVELSRLRWQRDIDMGREALTFDGEPATLPRALSDEQRLAVSFLLEEDRSRTMTLRSTLIDLRKVVADHIVAGGPTFEVGRLDYLLEWATAKGPVDFRQLSDDVSDRLGTPGARLSNAASDAIHDVSEGGSRANAVAYESLVLDALQYKSDCVDRAIQFLATIEPSALREAYRAIEADSQEVWRRRLALQASDLVRFGRTYRPWRNDQVELLDNHGKCSSQLAAFENLRSAKDAAMNAGVREIATADVLGVNPLRVNVVSRRIGPGTSVALLAINDELAVEEPSVDLAVQATGFKLSHLSMGRLIEGPDEGLLLDCIVVPQVEPGDELIVVDTSWFDKDDYQSGHELKIKRPGNDTRSAPKSTCTPSSYEEDPDEHQWCCRSHVDAESEWSDVLAQRRANGELNPDVWPPVVDEDEFDVPADGSPTSETIGSDPDASSAYDDMTMDDIE